MDVREAVRLVIREEEALKILASFGAVLTDGHFVYSSGRHGSAYVAKDELYPHLQETERLARALAIAFEFDKVDLVVAPAMGAIVLGREVAKVLNARQRIPWTVRSIYAEHGDKRKREHPVVIKRGYDKLVPGRHVLVVEDVLTTGGSAKYTVRAVKNLGGEVVGVAALCNRGGVTADDLGVPKLFALLDIPMDSYDERDCPLCANNIPINPEVGKGRKFLARIRASMSL